MREGLLIVNKPRGLTSHDVVALMRRKLGLQRIGHAGTLDPMAEGVLVLLLGAATKQQRRIQAHRKRYETVIQLGMSTDTGDAWGQPLEHAPIPALDRSRVESVCASLIGRLTQVPPAFSAIKVQGRPLYRWARQGTRLEAPARIVEILAMTVCEITPDRLRCRIECSAGTYIRSLAETCAQRLGTVGHVRELIRLAVGPWELSAACDLNWLLHEATLEAVYSHVQSLDECDAACHRP